MYHSNSFNIHNNNRKKRYNKNYHHLFMYNNFPLYLNLEVKNLHKIDILMLNKTATITLTCLRVIYLGECNQLQNQTFLCNIRKKNCCFMNKRKRWKSLKIIIISMHKFIYGLWVLNTPLKTIKKNVES